MRPQVPLKPAWALTVHKIQGSSLDLVKVDCKGAFECGQTYVALSRARSTAGLQVVNFTLNVVRCSPDAVGFHQSLSSGHVGALSSFVRSRPLWFHALFRADVGGSLTPRDDDWRQLFLSLPAYSEWLSRYPPSAAGSSPCRLLSLPANLNNDCLSPPQQQQ